MSGRMLNSASAWTNAKISLGFFVVVVDCSLFCVPVIYFDWNFAHPQLAETLKAFRTQRILCEPIKRAAINYGASTIFNLKTKKKNDFIPIHQKHFVFFLSSVPQNNHFGLNSIDMRKQRYRIDGLAACPSWILEKSKTKPKNIQMFENGNRSILKQKRAQHVGCRRKKKKANTEKKKRNNEKSQSNTQAAAEPHWFFETADHSASCSSLFLARAHHSILSIRENSFREI